MEKEQACIQTDWAEVLRTKGIRARGYGIVPKYAMQDTDLELTDKALYAYLCSLSGNDHETYPAVSTIKSHLKIGDKSFATRMKHLVETGYVEVKKVHTPGNKFSNNIYCLTQRPKKFFLEPPRTPKGKEIRNTILADGILGGGYGQIPKMVMCDARLDIKSKGIYAYLAAFTGAGEVAFPARDQILRELNILKGTYYRYFNPLLELNYVTVIKRKSREFERNQYVLNTNPDDTKGIERKKECPVSACPVSARTVSGGPVSASLASASPVSASPGIGGPVLAGVEKKGTTKITVPINTSSINSSVKHQSYLPFLPAWNRTALLEEIDKIDLMSREELQAELYEWYGVTDEYYGNNIDPDIPARERALVDYIVDYIQTGRPYISSGIKVSREEMIARLLQLDNEDIMRVGERVAEKIGFGAVSNPKAYALHSLYNQSISGKME